MKIVTDSKKIQNVLSRGVESIYPNREALEKVLKSGKKIRLYNGIDPTGKLHLGHLAVLKKLRQFQDLGHDVIVLIGDFTATIGDPTDKMAVRKPLSREQVLENAKNYKKQIGKVLNLKKPNIRFLYNEKWINKLKPTDLLKILSYFSVARILERDMFQKRMRAGKDILLHEFVYPVFQAYDGAIMDVDLEVGGNDQTFNMLRGRDLMKKMKDKEKFVMALRLLTDSAGNKMGKSEGNLIPLDEKPQEMFGRIMAWPDSLLEIGFELLTDLPLEKTKKISPRDAKAILAKEVVTLCYGKRTAKKSEEEFNKVFKEKKMPTKIPGIIIKEKTLDILALLTKTKLAPSRSEAKRLVVQKGVRIDGEAVADWRQEVQIKNGQIIQAGKRKFVRITKTRT